MMYQIWMCLGRLAGCHQRPERSFFFHGKQFPVCARCMGVFLGECVALFCFRVGTLPTLYLLAFCGLMFFDWLIQAIHVRESTNLRRLITGGLCGYGFGSLVLEGLVVARTCLRLI